MSRPQAEAAAGEDFQQASAAALRLLARREHSAQELRHKLASRGYSPSLTEEVIAALREENSLSDWRFAESYTSSRYARGFGPLRIEAELRERGVAPELIDDALSDAELDWAQSARRQRHKRFGHGLPADFAERARQMRFLQQRGFDSAQIRAALEASATAD